MPWPPRVSTLILLAWLAGCGSPKSHAQSGEAGVGQNASFGQPAVLARNEGEARMLQGRKPIWIKADPQTLGSRSQVTLGDSLLRAAAGATVFIPRGTWIGFRVTGTDTATIVFAFNVPGFEKCLRLLSAPVGTAFVSPPAQVVAAARRECHQVRRADENH